MTIYTKDYDNIWFTSDQHYNHANVIKYCSRPYCDVSAMNEALISNHNSLVSPRDIVFHIGDFSFANNEKTKSVYNRLNGTHHLIRGNHDGFNFKFTTDQDIMELTVVDVDNNKQLIVLCHYAMRVWNKSHYGAWQLYGHSHGTLPPIGKQHDVGVDNNNYFPVSFVQLQDIMKTRTYEAVDHHD